MQLSEINTATREGQLLMAAIAIATGPETNLEGEVPKFVEDVIESYEKMAKKIYGEPLHVSWDFNSEPPKTFIQKIETAINQHSIENESDTPDFILAEYVQECLTSFAKFTKMREKWFGKGLRIGGVVDLRQPNEPPFPHLNDDEMEIKLVGNSHNVELVAWGCGYLMESNEGNLMISDESPCGTVLKNGDVLIKKRNGITLFDPNKGLISFYATGLSSDDLQKINECLKTLTGAIEKESEAEPDATDDNPNELIPLSERMKLRKHQDEMLRGK